MGNESKRLAARLLDVRRSIKWVQKDGSNKHQGFSFVSSSGLLGSIKGALDSEGVVLIPSVVRAERGERATKNGGSEILTEVWMAYRIINADDPTDTIEISWYAQGLDTGERGVGKALTYAEKYLLLKLLQIPTDDSDPDAEDRPATTATEKPRQTSQNGQQASPRTSSPQGQRPAHNGGEEAGGATDKQKRMIWAIVGKLAGEGATKEEVKEHCDATAMRVCGVRVSALGSREASAVIDWLQQAKPEDLTDGVPF